jgi:hypothetical protein
LSSIENCTLEDYNRRRGREWLKNIYIDRRNNALLERENEGLREKLAVMVTAKLVAKSANRSLATARLAVTSVERVNARREGESEVLREKLAAIVAAKLVVKSANEVLVVAKLAAKLAQQVLDRATAEISTCSDKLVDNERSLPLRKDTEILMAAVRVKFGLPVIQEVSDQELCPNREHVPEKTSTATVSLFQLSLLSDFSQFIMESNKHMARMKNPEPTPPDQIRGNELSGTNKAKEEDPEDDFDALHLSIMRKSLNTPTTQSELSQFTMECDKHTAHMKNPEPEPQDQIQGDVLSGTNKAKEEDSEDDFDRVIPIRKFQP